MILSNHLPDLISLREFAVVEGSRRKAVLKVVHSQRGYHVQLQVGSTRLFTPAFTEDEAREHAKSCQVNLWKLAQSREAGLVELAESVLTRTA